MQDSHSFPSDDTETHPVASASTSSFRVNPASELLRARAISLDGSVPSMASSHLGQSMNGSWEYSSFSSDFGRPHDTDSRQGTSSSTATIRTSHSPSASLSVPKVAPVTKFIPVPPRNSVSKAEVWRDIVRSSSGRDKALKLIQYTFRLYLFLHFNTASTLSRRKFGENLTKRLQTTMSGLSLARKCLLLFNWLTPLLQITNPPPLPFFSTPPSSPSGGMGGSHSKRKQPLLLRFLHASPPTLLDLTNSVADDIFTCSRLGLVPVSIGQRADRIANWTWLCSTIAGLVEVGSDRAMVKGLMADLEDRIYDDEMDPSTIGRGGKDSKGKRAGDAIGLTPTGQPNKVDLTVGAEEADEGLQKLRKQYQALRITRWKLTMDLIFVSYEVFKIQRFREPVMTVSGLVSGILSSWKLYDKAHAELAKAGEDYGDL